MIYRYRLLKKINTSKLFFFILTSSSPTSVSFISSPLHLFPSGNMTANHLHSSYPLIKSLFFSHSNCHFHSFNRPFNHYFDLLHGFLSLPLPTNQHNQRDRHSMVLSLNHLPHNHVHPGHCQREAGHFHQLCYPASPPLHSVVIPLKEWYVSL